MLSVVERSTIGIYIIAFHEPKPLHKLVTQSWAAADFVRFRLYTDCASAWRAVLPKTMHNIEVVDVTLSDFFGKFYSTLGLRDADDFVKQISWLIRPEGFEFLGYYAAQLRPLLFSVEPMDVHFWGWSDNDVIINAEALKKHLECTKTAMLMCPQHTLFFEQFKIYAASVDVARAYSEMIDEFTKLRQKPSSPLEAQVVVRLALDPSISRDCIEFDRLAVHWIYYDLLVRQHHPDGKAPCNFDVTIKRDLSMEGSDGQIPLCFIADTEVKNYTEAMARAVDTALTEDGSYVFRWASSVPDA